jgi:uncharacterized linocin/CFP29 family protein
MENGNSTYLSVDKERWTRINNAIHDEGAMLRRARRDQGTSLQDSGRILNLFGEQNAFVLEVAGYKVDALKPGKPLSISAGQNLVPAKIWANFQLAPEQSKDENIVMALATKAAYLVALAEDYVLLHGAAAAPFLDKLNVSYEDTLKLQVGLFNQAQKQVYKPVLDSINEGIKQLRDRNHHGEFCAIVSPDLYQEAFARNDRMEAPICEIRSMLKKGGFMYSPAAPPKTGVVFSLGGRTIDLAVPMDACTERVDERDGVTILRVVEQLRLRMNDETAVVTLGEIETAAPMKAGKTS